MIVCVSVCVCTGVCVHGCGCMYGTCVYRRRRCWQRRCDFQWKLSAVTIKGPLHSVLLVGNNGRICVGGSGGGGWGGLAAWFDSKEKTAQLKGKWVGRDNVEQVQQHNMLMIATLFGILLLL